jgi:hypothetical protein
MSYFCEKCLIVHGADELCPNLPLIYFHNIVPIVGMQSIVPENHVWFNSVQSVQVVKNQRYSPRGKSP